MTERLSGLQVDELRPGVVYDVRFTDCCIEGTFVAELLRVERLSYPETTKHKSDDGHPNRLVFDGITLTEWSCVEFRELGGVTPGTPPTT